MIDISDKLKEKLKQIPEQPGIYRMMDKKGNIIYIGKSKCLKKRVKTYFANNPKWEKVNRMVTLIDNIDYTVTDTHLEARLLECSLIKSIKPIFNSQMKNDRRYVYLKVEDYNRHNSLKAVGERVENSFGPFRTKGILYEIIDSMKNLYPVQKTSQGYRFEYHLFPKPMEREMFNENRKALLELFSNVKNLDEFIDSLQTKMKEESSGCSFETAAMYRNMMQNMKKLRDALARYEDVMSRDILLKIPVKDGYKLFYISKGSIVLKEKFADVSDSIISSFTEKAAASEPAYTAEMDEKSQLDYRDILYSEITSLMEECVLEIVR